MLKKIYRTISQVTLFQNGIVTKLNPGTILWNVDVPESGERYYASIYGGLINREYIHDGDLFEEVHKDAMLSYTEGDLLRDAEQYDVIVHGANCFNTMGAGIALGVSKLFPQAERADDATESGDKSKLGTFTFAEDKKVTIVNAYTQYNPGIKELGNENRTTHIREWAIRKSMKNIKKSFSGKKIAMPLIGAGLAGGDWGRIEKIILEELYGEDITIVIWDRDSNAFFKNSYGKTINKHNF